MDDATCVQIINRVKSYRVNQALVKKIAVEICERLGVHHYEVSLQFVGPSRMRTLNRDFRQKDKSTDVLSFPQYQWKKPLKVRPDSARPLRRRVLNPMPLGDIVISIADADKNAKDSKHGLDYEVCFLMVHGILHLVGHDHMKASDQKLMFGEQSKLMSSLATKSKVKSAFSGLVSKIKKD